MKKYYILALDKTEANGRLMWWKPRNWGYTPNLSEAGVYTEKEINADPYYYNNKETIPVPVEEAENVRYENGKVEGLKIHA